MSNWEKAMIELVKSAVKDILGRKILLSHSHRVIFTYHDISSPSQSHYSEHYSTIEESFVEQLDFLQQHFQLVSLDEIVSAQSNGKRLAAITFDDGFFSVKEKAHRHLVSRDIPYTVFVNQQAVENNYLDYGSQYQDLNKIFDYQVYLSSSDIQEMASERVVFGGHGVSHKALTELSLKEVMADAKSIKTYLENLTHNEVKHFALPFGKGQHYSEKTLHCLFEVGYRYVYTSYPTSFQVKDRSSLIPRISVLNESKKQIIFNMNRALMSRLVKRG